MFREDKPLVLSSLSAATWTHWSISSFLLVLKMEPEMVPADSRTQPSVVTFHLDYTPPNHTIQDQTGRKRSHQCDRN